MFATIPSVLSNITTHFGTLTLCLPGHPPCLSLTISVAPPPSKVMIAELASLNSTWKMAPSIGNKTQRENAGWRHPKWSLWPVPWSASVSKPVDVLFLFRGLNSLVRDQRSWLSHALLLVIRRAE
ncbi:hypothetical protein VFPPC_16443 [Pochonia chlamydosporia 170]|uniref:Uncharacterized protein n=1 Tax=Pochonia chlamydosporia 170 TaxID=1380566 RepID=A0A179FCZ3_METCM|nr:hypothetical protein VFPPC_16443 [Pochonia chlamydosporia 170]OAQ63228.1 hypothetical protein VFPPC_16443 [Pochonia chlamydosporia 170]